MKHLTGFLLVSLACASVFAASEGTLSMDYSKANSSASNRLNKSFTILASPIGLGPSTNPESGLIAGVFISPKTLIQLEAGDGNSSNGFSFFGTSSSKIHTSSVSVAVKHFVSNSFYVKGGIDNRRLNYQESYKSSWSLFGSPANYEKNFAFEAESWSGSVVIGNQWQWDNFTLGCDWFGITAPLSSKVNSESYSETGSDQESVKRNLADEQKSRLKDIAYQGIKFYIGASF